MPRRRKPPPPPPRREQGQGSVTWVESRNRWRARLPKRPAEKPRESWHKTRPEAEAWITRELLRDATSFDPTKTLGVYLNYWYRLHLHRWKPLTQERYRSSIAAAQPIAAHPLERLRGDHIQELLAGMMARGLSRGYAYSIGSLIRQALADAVRWKILGENPGQAVTLPEPERTHARAWDEHEVRRFLTAIHGHRFEAVYLFILYGGLRIGEVMALRWDAIDPEHGTVLVGPAEWTNAGRVIGTNKSERDRDVDLPATVLIRLKALRAAMPVISPYIAGKANGSRWAPTTIRSDWSKLVARLKLQPISLHGGRHSFATGHMVAGTPLADLAHLMGHASPSITAKVYLSSSRERRREAASRLGDLFSGAKPPNEGQNEGQQPH